MNTRKIAVEVLKKVQNGRFVDDVMNSDETIDQLEQRDKNFIRAMVLNTIRHLGEIDHFLHRFTRKGKENKVDDYLRIGVAQIKLMEMPAFAVVNEMVDAAGAEGSERYKAFVNSVLRKVEGAKFERNAKLNFPKWMSGAWKKAYGNKAAEIMDILLSEPKYVDLSYKDGSTKRIQESGRVDEIEGFEEGEFWVQDISQRVPVEMLGDVADKKVLDMCAAPGGKTAQLIASGAKVLAVDSSPKRIRTLEENLGRLGMECKMLQADARGLVLDEQADSILLDAPCTATGTIRRNPEILLQRSLEDVHELVRIQNELIESAYENLKAGGELVYSTCSLQYEECEGLVKKLDPDHWQIVEEKRTLPTDHIEIGGANGAYCAKLRKL